MTIDGQLWICDRCGWRYFKSNDARGELPKGWDHVKDENDYVSTLCPDCAAEYRTTFAKFFGKHMPEVWDE